MSESKLPVCTIIGAGPGVSLAVARLFGRQGYKIAFVARNTEKLAAICEDLQPFGIESKAYFGDAGDDLSLSSAISQIHDELGPTEVLVYNAYAVHPAPPSQLSIHDLLDDFQVNVGGALVAAQAVLEPMKAAGKGTILFTGGGLALQPMPSVASLAIGKAGIRNLAFSLFQELQPAGIHVATVTICGYVQEGTHFSPANIAEQFLALHNQAPAEWIPEVIYR